ncbi:nephrin-like, partial [Penaeus monodon]|uniref:nephrin-like n=1 Tax=Penaeus monodon TaxID=6687 RepID=UPI0018A6E4CD
MTPSIPKSSRSVMRSVTVVVGGAGGSQRPVASVVGPFQEGEMLVLTCLAHGGSPRPSVVWFRDTYLIDFNMESEETSPAIELASQNHTTIPPAPYVTTLNTGPSQTTPEPYNTLTLGPLTRNDLKLLLTCEASNNNLTIPTSVVVMVDMNLAPLSVEIRGPEGPLVATREYQVMCEVTGSRPPPTVTWWKAEKRVMETSKTTSVDGNVTTSTLVISPQPEDDGTTIECVAENKATDTVLSDARHLTVHYLPTASASFGSSLDATNIKEGDDVYFECAIEANPRVSLVSWRHNNQVLAHNVSAGVIISNQSLVLQRVVRAWAGLYSCHAHNLVGDGNSNTLRLDVKYAPVCSPGQTTSYAVGRQEDAEVTCTVQANPPRASFQWTFNNTADTIDVPQGRFSSSSVTSVITYTPMTSLDYGTLLCWASNEIGTQREPCVFHIVPAGKPDPPRNCTVIHRSRTAVRVRCLAGSDGGLPQHFLLRAKVDHGEHAVNVTASTRPSFLVEGLMTGRKYSLVITAYNSKGSSAPTHMSISSPGASGSVYRQHDGPSEAEVRDGGKNGSSGGGGGAGGGDDG